MLGTLGRLFREQEAREERQRMRREYGVTYEDDGLGSFDDGDPYTTNLYVGNLAPTVDEEVLPPHTCFSVCLPGLCPLMQQLSKCPYVMNINGWMDIDVWRNALNIIIHSCQKGHRVSRHVMFLHAEI